MAIRLFDSSDTPELILLFRTCIHSVCKNDYSPEQLEAWAPAEIQSERWTKRFLESFTVISEDQGEIEGFANLENDGTVDMLYVSANHQGQGIAKKLFSSLKAHAKEKGIQRMQADVSITARSFFLKLGFQVVQEYTKSHQGLEFRNTLMSLDL